MSSFGGLHESIIVQIQDIIISHKPVDKIILFGSRATDDYKKTSDIDIAIFSKEWSDRDLNIIKHTLEEIMPILEESASS